MMTLFFDGMDELLRVVITAPVLYILAIGAIRISGKRSTSQMNNFDWVVTVAMGSLVGSGIILKDVTILETALAISLLLLMQFLITKGVMYSKTINKLVKPEPRLLMRNGEFLLDAMRKERITEGEIESAMRENGVTRVQDVAAVVLETDANLSVLTYDNLSKDKEITTMRGIE